MDAYRRYMEDEVHTNHPIENTILIYEKAIQRLRFVKKCYDDFKFSQADEQLDMLETTFMELKMQIDESASEELAEDLYRIYDYILEKIYEVYQFRKADSLSGIEENLRDLIEGFRGALKNEESNQDE